MKHLFIINPVAKKIRGRKKKLERIQEKISVLFELLRSLTHDVYITERPGCAIPYIRRYVASVRAESDETIRVHSIGGTGTLYEVINGVIGFPNMEVAAHPYGSSNSFIRYFENSDIFSSFGHQILNEAFPMDAIRCGDIYGISFGLIGLEAYANKTGGAWIKKGLPTDLCYLLADLGRIMGKNRSQNYEVQIDDEKRSGKFLSMMVANAPGYGVGLHPCVKAHPDDGKLEISLLKNRPALFQLMTALPYLYGRFPYSPRTERFLERCSAKKMKISSDEPMFYSVDSECFSATSVEFEVLPGAIRFVVPNQIDLAELPLIYKRPWRGRRGQNSI